MLRLTTLFALVIAMSAPSAYAEVDTRRYNNLNSVQCEDEQTIADMQEIWKDMRTDGGGRASFKIKILSSKTRGKTGRKLVCDVSVKINSKKMRGIFSLNFFSNGRWKVTFNPD